MYTPFSLLEHAVSRYSTAASVTPDYTPSPHSTSLPRHHQDLLLFLAPALPLSPLVIASDEIAGLANDAFLHTAGTALPRSIGITVAARHELASFLPQFHDACTLGLSFSAPEKSSIFIAANPLPVVMQVLGHELGHVLSPAAPSPAMEEAKAFAFQMAWTQAILKHDIGGLAASIDTQTITPASNGVHDAGFALAATAVSAGHAPLAAFSSFAQGLDDIVAGAWPMPSPSPCPCEMPAAAYHAAASAFRKLSSLYTNYFNRTADTAIHFVRGILFAPLGRGMHRLYNTVTGLISVNEKLRKGVGEMHRTLFHEMAHKFARADEYAVRALEKAVFGSDDNYYTASPTPL